MVLGCSFGFGVVIIFLFVLCYSMFVEIEVFWGWVVFELLGVGGGVLRVRVWLWGVFIFLVCWVRKCWRGGRIMGVDGGFGVRLVFEFFGLFVLGVLVFNNEVI